MTGHMPKPPKVVPITSASQGRPTEPEASEADSRRLLLRVGPNRYAIDLSTRIGRLEPAADKRTGVVPISQPPQPAPDDAS